MPSTSRRDTNPSAAAWASGSRKRPAPGVAARLRVPLLPDRSPARNAVAEKLVGRLGMLSADVRDPAGAARRGDRLLSESAGHGVVTGR